MNIEQELETVFGERLKKDEPMAKHLNFRIGGPAKYFVEIKSVEELQETLSMIKQYDIPYFILGGGSNTVFSDEPFEGIVLKMAMRKHEIDGTMVMAEAGVLSVALARATANAGLKGFTWAISLPGTIGGAVRGNAGCFGGEIKDNLLKAEVVRDGEIIELSNKELQFGYRESIIKHNNDIVLRAWFALEEGDAEALKQELIDTVTKRKDTQPLHAGSAGCMFKNHETSTDEMHTLMKKLDIPESMQKMNRISAGWIIDQLQLKGTRIGDAEISNEHGNFLINHGNASSEDIGKLITLVKEKVEETYDIKLEEEVKLI